MNEEEFEEESQSEPDQIINDSDLEESESHSDPDPEEASQEIVQDGSESVESDPEESESFDSDPQETSQVIIQCSAGEELVAYVQLLQCDVQQLSIVMDHIHMSIGCVIFLLLFIWAERKIKTAIMKISGGKRNADID